MNKLQYLTLALALLALISCAALEAQIRRFEFRAAQFATEQAKLNMAQEKINRMEAQRSVTEGKFQALETQRSQAQGIFDRNEVLFEAIVARRLGVITPIAPIPAP